MSSGIELFTEPNQDVLISAQLSADSTGLFPQAVIYDIQDLTTPIETIDLDEIGQGAYAKKWTNPGDLTKYWVRLFVYTDSGHTTLSAFDRPAEISINVGRYQGGGYLGGSSGSKVVRTKLTDEEIKKIAEKVLEILKPELDKKSEFNSELDIVKTEPQNIIIPKYNEDRVINEINRIITENNLNLSKAINDLKKSNTNKEILIAISKIKDHSPDLNLIKSLIKGIKVSETKIQGVEKLIEPIKYYLFTMGLSENSNPLAVFKGISELSGSYKKKAFLNLLKYPNLAKQVIKL
jgi:hypothetical protein